MYVRSCMSVYVTVITKERIIIITILHYYIIIIMKKINLIGENVWWV